ncbi:MAG: C1 family peptidase [candidate division KSB1 bacterium]|nr:C1 family peptidase [candidate division KSB1 bacterium]
MRRILVLLFVCAVCSYASDSAITDDMLQSFKENLSKDTHFKAAQNAVAHNDVRDIARNRDMQGKIDDLFTDKIDVDPVTDQQSSGRCWLFTSLNVLRPKVMETLNVKSFEFSENYSYFWDQLEKANLFLENVISTRDKDITDRKVEWLFRHPIGDGGLWNNAVAVIEKYGMVPKSVMPESHNSENTRVMRYVVRQKLRRAALAIRDLHEQGADLEQLRQRKQQALTDVYKLLVLHLGEPPESFTWRYRDKDDSLHAAKTYTPMSFYNEVVGTDLNDYVMLMHDPTREFYKLYEIEWDRNRYDAQNWTYVNLPLDELKQMAVTSIRDHEAMYFSCDVGKQMDRDAGILSIDNYEYEALFGVPLSMSKKQRILSRQSGSSHAMSLMGVDTTADGSVRKWLLENSWGKESGHNGFMIMTDEWFDEYMFRLVVKKEFVPAPVLAVLKQTPIKLAPWDPMYLPYEDQ